MKGLEGGGQNREEGPWWEEGESGSFEGGGWIKVGGGRLIWADPCDELRNYPSNGAPVKFVSLNCKVTLSCAVFKKSSSSRLKMNKKKNHFLPVTEKKMQEQARNLSISVNSEIVK